MALQTRGFLALRLELPLPNYDGWTKWLKGDPSGLPDNTTWYIDGSYFGEAHKRVGSTGFGVVVLGPEGEVCGLCYGAPPSWITSAAGAEGWALYTALRSSTRPPRVVTDCLGLVTQLERGLSDATAPHRPLARLWGLIAAALDGAVPEQWLRDELAWMPAHTSMAAIGRMLRSDGRPVSRRDWRANRVVDKLAKTAAGFRTPPRDLLKLLHAANAAAQHAGACLGLTTFAANNYRETAWRPDGTAVATLYRDAWLPPFLDRGTGHRTKATGPRPPAQNAEPQPAETQNASGAAERNALEAAARSRLQHSRAASARARASTRLKDAEAEARGLQAWLADKAAEPKPDPAPASSATERLEALRRRVAARASAAHAGPQLFYRLACVFVNPRGHKLGTAAPGEPTRAKKI